MKYNQSVDKMLKVRGVDATSFTFQGAEQQVSGAEQRSRADGLLLSQCSQSSQRGPQQLPLGVGQLAVVAVSLRLQGLTAGQVLQLGCRRSGRGRGSEGHLCNVSFPPERAPEEKNLTRHCRRESTVRSLAASCRSLRTELRVSWCSSARGPNSRSIWPIRTTGVTSEEEKVGLVLCLLVPQTDHPPERPAAPAPPPGRTLRPLRESHHGMATCQTQCPRWCQAATK